jgi:hypothetical protein
MKQALTSLALLGLLILLASGLSGCVATNPDDSDHPWNIPPPNEGVPTLPGMNG